MRMQSVFGVSQALQQAAQKELSDMLLLRVPSDGQFAFHVARDRCPHCLLLRVHRT
jgi:hypothetical protein